MWFNPNAIQRVSWLSVLQGSINTLIGTHINFPMKPITLKSLMKMHSNISMAVQNKKSYTMQDPSDYLSVLDEFTKIKQECDELRSEQEKLLRVLAQLQAMAESVQKIIQE